MAAEWLILDGYSLMYRDPGLRARKNTDFNLSRQHLVRRIQQACDQLATRSTIVFDGRGGNPGEEFTFPGMDVIFSPQGRTADAVIERMVTSSARPSGILVVSNDRMILDVAGARGCSVMSCGNFLEVANNPPPSVSRLSKPQKGTGPKLGDFFPDKKG